MKILDVGLQHLLSADTNDLKQLAKLSGMNVETFYEGSDVHDIDVRDQDIRGLSFANCDIKSLKFNNDTMSNCSYLLKCMIFGEWKFEEDISHEMVSTIERFLLKSSFRNSKYGIQKEVFRTFEFIMNNGFVDIHRDKSGRQYATYILNDEPIIGNMFFKIYDYNDITDMVIKMYKILSNNRHVFVNILENEGKYIRYENLFNHNFRETILSAGYIRKT